MYGILWHITSWRTDKNYILGHSLTHIWKKKNFLEDYSIPGTKLNFFIIPDLEDLAMA